MSLTSVNVLNSNDFPLEDAYDGVRYTFPPGNATGSRPKRLSKGLPNRAARKRDHHFTVMRHSLGVNLSVRHLTEKV
jgi:hypothetical protein